MPGQLGEAVRGGRGTCAEEGEEAQEDEPAGAAPEGAQEEPGSNDRQGGGGVEASGQLGAGPAVLNALFLGFMFAFAVKAPLWPLHTWLPGAAVSAIIVSGRTVATVRTRSLPSTG